ncbi:hypothetical protein KEM09_08270 [Carboxylicivirga mesophila]|uniref:EcxA zinc-binding domain-containing protein n=1 Tax=Carboxylicivirga mesophila TaxID=1166478 RepID=A0ABS5K942_9BACT|nr:hypothetical protein [Carboxylicivirga mesophila]MBS2211392.1 hypothetical protein [Carboxylicivirga mesophila]
MNFRHCIKQIGLSFLVLCTTTSYKICYTNDGDGQHTPNSPTNWLSVKSWNAEYEETYRSSKQWASTPEVTYTFEVNTTISGRYVLNESVETDGYSFGEWYGYGSGSMHEVKVVKMISESSDGRIVITETTETKGSGQIGNPALNEYGEFWGGYLSIDISTNSYGVGFNGHPANSESNLTRTVEGLPTDYSALSQLPAGLREIFVPLGEKAEEWATYSGPLEEAESVMPVTVFAANLMPDFDEPKDYPLPPNGTTLSGLYSGPNLTKRWKLYPSGMKMPEIYVEIMDKDWLPEDDNTVEVKLSWDNIQPSEIEFTLSDISAEPGTCLNSADDNTDPDMDIVDDRQAVDYTIEKRDRQIIAVSQTESSDQKEAIIVISSLDFGAYATIKARIKAGDKWYDARVKEQNGRALHLPYDENENHIADKWEKDVGIFDRNLSASWDFDPYPEHQKNNGDGYSNYEEYRGFFEQGHLFKDSRHEQVKGKHVRTDPMHKDVFVYDQDGLFREHYAPYNPANLNWHYIDNTLMKYTGNVEDDLNRWVNYRTSDTYSNQKQYAMWVRYWPVGGNTPVSAGESPMKSSCGPDYPGDTPLKCIYMVKITQQGILNALSGITNQARKQRLFSELLTSTVIHEVGHGLGIRHHYNNTGTNEPDADYWVLGVKDCAIRYESDTEIQHNDKISLLKTHYCRRGETWIRVREEQHPDGTAPQDIPYETHPAHNCYWYINIKGE